MVIAIQAFQACRTVNMGTYITIFSLIINTLNKTSFSFVVPSHGSQSPKPEGLEYQ